MSQTEKVIASTSYPLPHDEEGRMRALKGLRILDTPPEERFDRIVQLAAKLFGMPIAYVALLDGDRQWFKSREGLCEEQTDRGISFCTYTILQDEPMIILDTHENERFKSNPMVTGDPFARFYAGVPIAVEDGHNVGTLCLMDHKPRDFSEHDTHVLKELAALVKQQFELIDLVELQGRLLESQKELAEEKRKSDALLHNILPDHVAAELKANGVVAASQHENVCVVFTDFSSFTAKAADMSPRELVHELDFCFSEFDRITEKHGVDKLKTIGDGYMCICGLEDEPHAHTAVLNAAFEMRDFVLARQKEKAAEGINYWSVRIGIHAGPIVAGVVGSRKFAFDIWGDTVNIASRMEVGSEPGKINATGEFVALLEDGYQITPRGKIAVKGRGELEQFFIEPKAS
ncbi:MAG: adenylate/guanylate cyclase domain-containing protein [Chthoniobacterales bacterium]